MSLIETILVSLRLRKPKKTQPENLQGLDLAGIINAPVEAKTASFEMKTQDIAPSEPLTTIPHAGAEKTGLKLEDELPEEKVEKIPARESEKIKPAKKGSRKKKSGSKETVARRDKKTANKPEINATREIIPIPATEEAKPEKEEPIIKKATKKKAREKLFT